MAIKSVCCMTAVLFTGLVFAGPDLTADLEYLGNYSAVRWPSVTKVCGITELQFYRGLLFCGSGEVEANPGPVPMYSIDPYTCELKFECQLGTEQVSRMMISSWGDLVVPSQDPREVQEVPTGHVFTRDADGKWTTYATIKGTMSAGQSVSYNTHVWDMTEFKGGFFAAGYGLTQSTDRFASFFDSTGVSSGGWSSSYSSYYHMAIKNGKSATSESSLRRQVQFLQFPNDLFAIPKTSITPNSTYSGNSGLLVEVSRYDEGSKAFKIGTQQQNTLYPGLAISDLELCCDDTEKATFTSKPYSYITCRPWHTTQFKGRCLYVLSRDTRTTGVNDLGDMTLSFTSTPMPLAAYSATVDANHAISATRISFGGDNKNFPWDFAVSGGTIYALTSKCTVDAEGSTVALHKVWKSTDGVSFSEVLSFTYPENMMSLEYRDGYFYFGVGYKDVVKGYTYSTKKYAAGSIYRVRCPQEPIQVVASVSELAVPEQGSANIAFSLSAAPSSNLTMRVGVTSANPRFTTDRDFITFTPSDWATPKTVVVSLANDGVTNLVTRGSVVCGLSGDDVALGAFAGPEVTSASVVLTPVDNDEVPKTAAESFDATCIPATYRVSLASFGREDGVDKDKATIVVTVYSDEAMTQSVVTKSQVVSALGQDSVFTFPELALAVRYYFKVEIKATEELKHVLTRSFVSPHWTEDDYALGEIRTPADFIAAMSRPDGSYKVLADINLAGSAYSTVPVFSGRMDGRGHTLSGLGTQVVCQTNRGVFASLRLSGGGTEIAGTMNGAFCTVSDGGTFTNCTVSGYRLRGTAQNSTLGVFAATAGNGARFAGCAVDSSCVVSQGVAYVSMGGFVGRITGGTSGRIATFTDCTNAAQIVLTHNGTATRGIGGIAGDFALCESPDNPVVVFARCVNRGALRITGSNATAGGIIGCVASKAWGSADLSVSARFIGCVNEGTITGTGGAYAGGIVGDVYFTHNVLMDGCVNRGAINCSDVTSAGGLVGEIGQTSCITVGDGFTIRNCANYANVAGKSYAGGIFGRANMNAYASLTLRFLNSANYGTISGASKADVIPDITCGDAAKNRAVFICVSNCWTQTATLNVTCGREGMPVVGANQTASVRDADALAALKAGAAAETVFCDWAIGSTKHPELVIPADIRDIIEDEPPEEPEDPPEEPPEEPDDPPVTEQLNNLPYDGNHARFELPTTWTWPAEDYGAEVCLWRYDRFAAVSYGHDDNLSWDVPFLLNEAEKNHLKLTWWLITDKVREDMDVSGGGTWDIWRGAFAAGHAIESHTHTHEWKDGARTVSAAAEAAGMSVEDYVEFCMYSNSLALIREKIPGCKPSTLAYPGGEKYPEIAAKYFVSGRGVQVYINKANNTDYMNVNASTLELSHLNLVLGGWGGTKTLSDWRGKFNGDPQYHRGWYVPFDHNEQTEDGVARPGYEKQVARLREKLAILGSHRHHLWLGTYPEVAKYGQSRDTATLTVGTKSAAKITFTLSDRMRDDWYDEPLTVKIRLPAAWTEAGVAATQGSATRDACLVEHEGAKYALVNAVPDRGEVMLVPAAANSGSWDPTSYTTPNYTYQVRYYDETGAEVLLTNLVKGTSALAAAPQLAKKGYLLSWTTSDPVDKTSITDDIDLTAVWTEDSGGGDDPVNPPEEPEQPTEFVTNDWFNVEFEDAGYRPGSDWTKTSTDKSGGTWSGDDGEATTLDATTHTVVLSGDFHGELLYTPSAASEANLDVIVEGSIQVTAAPRNLRSSDVPVALTFEAGSAAGLTPVVYVGGAWHSFGTTGFSAGSLVDWKFELDHASAEAPRVRVTVADKNGVAETSGWIAGGFNTKKLSSLSYVGTGSFGDFKAHYLTVKGSEVVELVRPEFATDGSALGFLSGEGGNRDFALKITNPVKGAYYTVLVSTTLDGPFLPEGDSVLFDKDDGTLILKVAADTPQKFAKILVTLEPYTP